MDDPSVNAAADPLHEQRELAERLAGLIAGDDERRSVLVFGALMNLVDDEAVRRVPTVPVRGAGPPRTRSWRPDAPSAPADDSVYGDPVFLANARRLMGARTRIVGGIPTRDYPDCVAVGGASGWCCSGTLVASNVVVTAGHCVQGGCCSRVSWEGCRRHLHRPRHSGATGHLAPRLQGAEPDPRPRGAHPRRGCGRSPTRTRA